MGGRRGQLLLIGGLGIAVTFVVLAVVLNTVIFTQNLATREAVDARSPVAFSGAVDRGVGGAISEANYHNTTDYGMLHAELRRAVSTWAGNASRFGASRGLVTDVALTGTTNGTRVLQSSMRPWTNETGTTAWTMATGVDQTRRFHANVSRSSLATDDGTNLASGGAFRIQVENTTTGDTWSLYIFRESGDTDRVNLTAIEPDDSVTSCNAVDTDVDIDVTEATVEETDCGFSFAAGVDAPYQIAIQHGENATGRYTVVVDRERPDLLGDVGEHYNSTDTTNAPYTLHAIYGAELHVTVDRADITYTRNMTVAPEDPVLGERYNVSA